MVVKYIVTQALKAGVKKVGRKTLTADKGALRISEINKKLKKTPSKYQQDVAENYAQEVSDIYEGKWKSKK
jgi:DNA repair photolyase